MQVLQRAVCLSGDAPFPPPQKTISCMRAAGPAHSFAVAGDSVQFSSVQFSSVQACPKQQQREGVQSFKWSPGGVVGRTSPLPRGCPHWSPSRCFPADPLPPPAHQSSRYSDAVLSLFGRFSCVFLLPPALTHRAVEFKGERKQFSAEEISSMVLSKMREVAETYLGKKASLGTLVAGRCCVFEAAAGTAVDGRMGRCGGF